MCAKMFIPNDKYSYILNVMPICCVDVVVAHEDKVLLILRKESEDYGGLWWVPGGRINKNERWHDAVRRKVLEETGLNVEVEKQIQSYEAFSAYEGVPTGTHCITTTFLTRPTKPLNISLDETSDDWQWVHQIEDHWHPILKQMLRDAKVIRG